VAEKVGKTNLTGAEKHYKSVGEEQGLDCECDEEADSGDDVDDYGSSGDDVASEKPKPKPSGPCDWKCYLANHPNVKKDPPCDWQCYLDRYSDLAIAFGATNVKFAEHHYKTAGKEMGRYCFCPQCDWQCYLDKNPDVAEKVGKTNLTGAEKHYKSKGAEEGRNCECFE